MTFDVDPLGDMVRYPSATRFRTARKAYRCDVNAAPGCGGVSIGERYALIKFPPGSEPLYSTGWTSMRECSSCADYCVRGEPWASAEKAADDWNAEHPRGTAVRYWPAGRTGPGVPSTTRSPAWALFSGQAVVSVDGYAGGIALTHVEVVEGRTGGRRG